MLYQRLVVQSLHVFPYASHPLLCIKHYEALLYFPLWGILPLFEGTWKWLYRWMMKHELVFSCSTQAKRQETEWLILAELSLEYPPQLWWRISWGARVPNPFREQDHFCVVLWNGLQKESALVSSVKFLTGRFSVCFPFRQRSAHHKPPNMVSARIQNLAKTDLL